MLQEPVDYQGDLQQLLDELNGISSDLSQYLLFLNERQYLIQQILLPNSASNN